MSVERTVDRWQQILQKQQVASIMATSWPTVCTECQDDDPNCWKCQIEQQKPEREPAIKIVFENGAELLLRPLGAALFIKEIR